MLAAVLTYMTADMYIVRAHDTDDERAVFAACTNEAETLAELSGLPQQEGDLYLLTLGEDDDHLELSIEHAFQVTVSADGTEQNLMLHGGTVEQALEQCDITLGENDFTEPALTTSVNKGDTIFVHRVEYKETTTTETIPFETETVYTSLYYRKPEFTKIAQEGKDGQKEITHRRRFVDGTMVADVVVNERIAVEPQNEIIMSFKAGAAISPETGPEVVEGVPAAFTAMYSGRATAYSSSGGRGASGLGLHLGTVSVDPNLIPFGTKVYITSPDGVFVYGYAIASDTGASLREGHAIVDMFYESREDALMSAAQQVNVYVIG